MCAEELMQDPTLEEELEKELQESASVMSYTSCKQHSTRILTLQSPTILLLNYVLLI